MRKPTLLVLLLIFTLFFGANAQTDTTFWFAAPEVSYVSNLNQPVYLRVTTFDKPATITITEPANGSFVPIIRTITASSNYSFDLTDYLDEVMNSGSNSVTTHGLKITSTANVQVYYEVAAQNNNEIFPLKGGNALGTDFIVPSMERFSSGGYGSRKTMFYVLAAEDNTVITVIPSVDLQGRSAGVSFTVNLDKGEVYCGEAASKTEHIGGTQVTANNAVAITTVADLTEASGCADVNGDQIVPVRLAGNTFITLPGYLNEIGGSDFVNIYPTQDNTVIYINGSLAATKNRGEYYEYASQDEILYIETSAPSLIYQLSGFSCEVGGGVVPQINCTGSTKVGITRSTDENFYLNLLCKTGSESFFTVNGNASIINSGDFSDVPNTSGEWKYARKLISNEDLPAGAAAEIKNAKPFHLGLIHGGGGGCKYGYFSNFGSFIPDIEVSNQGKVCAAENLTSKLITSFTGSAYQWKKNGAIIPGAIDSFYVASTIGDYTIDVTQTGVCGIASSNAITVTEGCPPPSPAGVSEDLALWLDASDPHANGTLPTNGTALSTWKDRSPEHNDAVIVEGQTPAAYSINQINDKPVLNFERISDNQGSFYSVDNLDIRAATNPDITIFSVYKPGAHASNELMGVWGNDNQNWDRFFLCTWGQGENGAASFGPGNITAANVLSSGTVGKTRLLTAVYDGNIISGINDGKTDSSAIYFNGKLVTAFADHTDPSDAQTSFRIGYDGDNSAFNGDIAEVIVYKRKLSYCEIQQVNKYLGDKYGENFTNADVTLSTPTGVICPDASITMTASQGASYKWLKDEEIIANESASTYAATTAGSYRVVVTQSEGCSDTSAAVALTKSTLTAAITSAGPLTFCSDESVELSAPSGFEYEWYANGDQLYEYSETITAFGSGAYTVKVTDYAAGCTATTSLEDAVNIVVYDSPDPSIYAQGPTSFCPGGSVVLKAAPGLEKYEWYLDDEKISGVTGDEYLAKKAGSYSMHVKSTDGCISTVVANSELSTHLTIYPVPNAIITADGPLPCTGTATLSAPEDMTSYVWKLNGTTLSENGSTLSTANGGSYLLTVTDYHHCSATSASSYLLKLNPQEDCDGDGILNGVECPLGINCGDCNNDGVADYLDNKSCSTAIMMPTLFSPNGDGKNDLIKPVIPGISKFISIKIFNRWGNIVFESKDANKGWDGTLGGKAQPQDTYIWIATGIGADGKTITQKGLISLLR